MAHDQRRDEGKKQRRRCILTEAAHGLFFICDEPRNSKQGQPLVKHNPFKWSGKPARKEYYV